MLRFYLLLVFIICGLEIEAQQLDSLECKEYFDFYDDMRKGKGLTKERPNIPFLITFWTEAPVLLEESNFLLTKMELLLQENQFSDYVYIALIINENGIPCCFKLDSPTKMADSLKVKLIADLQNLCFRPAKMNDKFVKSKYPIILQRKYIK